MVNRVNPKRLRQHGGNLPGRRVYNIAPAKTQLRETQGNSDIVRPWRQWHTAGRAQEVAPLEVTSAKKPQWGRYIYFAVVLGLLSIFGRAAYLHLFWFNTQGLISGRQYNVAPAQTVSASDILVTPSEKVVEGQPLVKLDSPELVQALAQNEAEIARIQTEFTQNHYRADTDVQQLQAEIRALQAEMSVLENQYARETRQIDALRKLIDAGAAQSGHLDTLETQHGQTLAEYRRAEAELEAASNQFARLQETREQSQTPALSERLAALTSLRKSIQRQLENLELRAPITGMVAQVPISRGEVLRAGEPAVVLVDKNELRAYLYFAPEAQSKLREGMTVPVYTPDGAELNLRIAKIYPAMENLPTQFMAQDRQRASALVVEALPEEGSEFPLVLTSGTPIEGRIPRWSFTAMFNRNLTAAFDRSVEKAEQILADLKQEVEQRGEKIVENLQTKTDSDTVDTGINSGSGPAAQRVE